MWIPAAYSEPVPVRIDPVWKHPSPMIRPRISIPAYHSRGTARSGDVRSDGGPRVPGSVHGSVHPSVPPSSRSSPTPDSPDEGRNRRRNRCWLMNILMAPCDFVEWLVNKWGKPSNECMDCVKVTYWIVLIVGGIVTTVMAVAPFL
jgi:hypothetical protein